MKKKRSPKPSRRSKRPPALIALLTDFGLEDHYVGTLKGVIHSINPDARIVDLSHQVQPQQVRQAGYLLWSAYKFFPAGTIFASVVDPGVGSSRRVILVETRGLLFVAPDNGLLDFVLSDGAPAAAVEVDRQKAKKFLLPDISRTFHGRDIFAPIAAYLSLGTKAVLFGTHTQAAQVNAPFVRSKDDVARPVVLHIDHFGNIITNIAAQDFEKASHSFSVAALGKGMVSTWSKSYSEAPEKTPCLVVGSSGLVEISVKNDNAARLLNVVVGAPLRVYWQ